MPRRTIVREAKDLPAIIGLIHDCWFDIADVVFHPRQSLLSIRYKRPQPEKARILRRVLLLKWIEVPLVECFLEVGHVIESQVEDRQGIRLYDLNTVAYDGHSNTVRVETGIPTTITMKVSELEVSVEETDNVVELEMRRVIFVWRAGRPRRRSSGRFAAVIRERLGALTAKSFDELAALPSTSTEELLREGAKMFVSVWHDVLGSGEHRIAVQAGKRGWLASWRGGADGFAINSHNERRALTDEELSPFT